MEREFLIRKNFGFSETEHQVLRAAILILILVFISGTMETNILWAMETGVSFSSQADFPDEPDSDESIQDLLNETGAVASSGPVDAGKKKALPFRYEGEVLSSLWVPAHDVGEDLVTSDRLNFKAWGETGNLTIRGRLRVDYQDLEKEDRFRTDLRELIIGYRFRAGTGSYMDLEMGKKILYWGKGDEVRPIDRISPQDLTSYMFYDLNDRKTGRVGAFLTVDAGERFRIEGFWSPYFEAGDIPGEGGYFEPGALCELRQYGIQADDEVMPDDWTGDAGFGGRVMTSLFKTDIAIYAFQGYDPNPTYIVRRVASDAKIPLSVAAVHPRMALYGMDAERSIGDYVIRAEAAFQENGALFTVNWPDDLSLLVDYPKGVIEKHQLQYVLGVDKNNLFVRNLFVNFQVFEQRIFDHEPVLMLPESLSGMTAFFRYTCLDSKVEIKYRYTGIFRDNDQRHQLELAYRPTASVRVAFGGIVYDGDDPTATFAQYDDRDFMYGNLKFIF